jgi:hypothetical protein
MSCMVFSDELPPGYNDILQKDNPGNWVKLIKRDDRLYVHFSATADSVIPLWRQALINEANGW